MLDRPRATAVLRRFALPSAASCLAAGAILWPGAAWFWRTGALLAAGALMVLTELPSPALGGATLRGRAATMAVAFIVIATVSAATAGVLVGGPARLLVPAALVILALHLVGHAAEGGMVARRPSVEAAIALAAALVAVGAEQARRLDDTLLAHQPSIEVEAPVPEPAVQAPDGGAPAPYSTPDPDLPPAFGGDGGAASRQAGSCPEELTEESSALVWMRLWERRDEGAKLLDEEGRQPAAVVPRRLHCACAPHRDRPELTLAYCGRTRELCQAEAGTRAGVGSCGVVAVSIVRRLDCRLDARGISVRADEASLGVSIRSIAAASKLVPQWATLDARELSRGRLVPIRVQRLRWSRGSTAPTEWRATNFPGAGRAASALGRTLARAGLRCRGQSCEGGDGRVTIDWCAGKNQIGPAQGEAGAAQAKKGPGREGSGATR
ncbi:MAG: hypothetical protein HYY06_03600 [Deltaproteobacteria bacterium]|nr:hypothetical protein [Deltaproteobacteria bacterium]